MRNFNKIALSLLAIIAMLALLPRGTPAQDKIKFPVGVGTKTIGTNMFWLATKKGFLNEAGLEVQPVLLRGSAITMQALVSASVLDRLTRRSPGWRAALIFSRLAVSSMA
jgi:ABC-type nitrate/sulfonate/bicarbonate transport system substrate-binding protein